MNLQELIKPTGPRVLVELVQESAEYTPGVMRLNPNIEPYQVVISVGEDVKNMKPGDLVLTRNMNYESFSLFKKSYCLLYQTDITAVIDPIIAEEIKTSIADKKKDLQIN